MECADGKWRCYNPPCQYARALARVPAIVAAAAMLLFSLAVSANAQTVIAAGSQLGVVWEAPVDPKTGLADYVEYYLVKQGSSPGATASTVRVDSGREYRFTPADPSKVQYFRVSACKVVREAGKDNELCAPDSNEANTSAFIVTPPVDDCSPPLGADALSVFVTRVTQAGQRTWITLQLGSRTPVLRLTAKVDGADVLQMPRDVDADVSDSAGMWIPTPAKGKHRVSVAGRNRAGCSAEGVAILDFIAK